jgi:hypothetical protein
MGWYVESLDKVVVDLDGGLVDTYISASSAD